MVSFEFVVTNGSPKRATAAVRSHAVRSGLSQKNKEKSTASGKENSRLTIFRRSSLRGRFKLNDEQKAETRKRGSPGSSSSRQERRREASCSVISESVSPAETHADSLAGSQAESRAESLAVVPVRTPTEAPAAAPVVAQPEREVVQRSSPKGRRKSPTQWEMPTPPLVRSPGSPLKPHKVCTKQRVDPFISLFLSHMNIKVPSSLVTRKYFGFAVCDQSVLHSALGIAAMMWSISLPNPKKGYNEGYKQKALAIPSIHARLQANDVSSTVIGAIANLAQMEAIEKNYEAARVHLHAIEIIAQRKGGYGCFVDDTELATSLNWSDLLLALMSDSKPTLMLLTNVEDVPIHPCAKRLAEMPSVSHLRVFEDSPYDTSIRDMFTSVRQAIYAAKFELGINDTRILCNSLDHRLCMLIQSTSRCAPVYPLLIAVQLIMALVVRETEIRCILVESLVPRLIASLQPRITCEALPKQEYWCGLAWCTWIGIVTTVPHSEEWEWFYQRLVYLLSKLGIVDCIQFKTVMQRFLWDSYRCETTLEKQGAKFLKHSMITRTTDESAHDGGDVNHQTVTRDVF